MSRTAFKICIFGDGGVGKTTLINRYVTGVFTDDTIMTIGVGFHVKKVEIKGKVITLQIWDFAGEDRFRFLLPAYIKGAVGGIFMFDITRYASLKNLKAWSEVIDECTNYDEHPLPILLVGGKQDLEEKRAIKQEYGRDISDSSELFIDYIECSSLTGHNVEHIFHSLTKEIVERKGLL